MRVSHYWCIFLEALMEQRSCLIVALGYFVFVWHWEFKKVICADLQVSKILLHQNIHHRSYSHCCFTGKKGEGVPFIRVDGVYCGQLYKARSSLKTQRDPSEMGRKARPPAWGRLTSQEFLLVLAELVMICVDVVTHRGGTERTLIKFAGMCRMAGDVAVCQLYIILDLIVWPPNFYSISGIKLLCLCVSPPTFFNYVILFSFTKWYHIKGSKKKARIWIKSYKDEVVHFLTCA